jgi:hypothetical protein
MKTRLIGITIVLLFASIASVSFAGSGYLGTVGPGQDVYEPDNSRGSATNIAVGQMQFHTINIAGDVDWTRFAPPSTQSKYRVTIYADTIDLVAQVWVKLGLLPEVFLTNKGTIPKGTCYSYIATPSTGTAYYKHGVWGSSRAATGSYRIKVENY